MTAVCIEKCGLICHSIPEFFRDGLIIYHQSKPVVENHIHNKIYYPRGEWDLPVNTRITLSWR